MPPLFFVRTLPCTEWLHISSVEYLSIMIRMLCWPSINEGTTLAVFDPDAALEPPQHSDNDPPPPTPSDL